MSKITILLDQTHPSDVEEEVKKAFSMPVLQEVKVNMNITSAEPPLEAIKPFLPLFLDIYEGWMNFKECFLPAFKFALQLVF